MRLRRRTVVAMLAGVALGPVLYYTVYDTAPGRPSVGAARPLTEQEKDLLHDAEELLTHSCMAARGFKTWVVPRRPLPEDRDFPYVVDDVEWASRHGYGSDIQAQRERLRASDPNRRYFAGLSPAQRQRALDALHGRRSARRLEVKTPNGMTVGRIDDGCTAQAQKKLYGDLKVWFRVSTITEALTSLQQRQTTADAEFAKSVKEWSRCMKERGFNYSDPNAARASFMKPGKARPRKTEVRTAVAEAGCARSSGLSSTAQRLEQRYGERLRRTYADDVRTRMRLEVAALERARSIVRNK
ncbi:hypothetical protein Acsp04_46700 [Actinomadura sp. NBRC 104425]|uniref:hypothetical protein n=1 Tax=Actinomadura sp. NBRC 104425 TaxID=3032204 RepID=UPI0024A5AB79|nr:hypothetical protein [Actinomadura sp. NBRC 104425]GLZ14435.1 hypothetical protein Acsp04_46700 [Actinomadura sp. NBRC 104425]